jgi:hypothetical protein
MKKDLRLPFSHSEGWLSPLIYRIFSILKQVSILTHLKRKWPDSRIVVDTYVVGLFLVGFFVFFLWIGLGQLYNWGLPDILLTIAFYFTCYRLLDIFQSWFFTLFSPPYNAKWPRLLILTLINYMEIAIAFSIIGFYFKAQPYYGVSEITIWDSLRHSLGVLTPLGITESEFPLRWSGFSIFWIEYIVGLLFIVVVINLVLSHYKRNAD